jgi:hypothetical protein
METVVSSAGAAGSAGASVAAGAAGSAGASLALGAQAVNKIPTIKTIARMNERFFFIFLSLFGFRVQLG